MSSTYQWRRRRRLCPLCGAKSQPHYVCCSTCRAKARHYQHARLWRLRRQGVV
jgi:predicted amidophosphoribosyltransferase